MDNNDISIKNQILESTNNLKLNINKSKTEDKNTSASSSNPASAVNYYTQVQNILIKIARNEKLTEEEQDLIDNDTDLARKVQTVKAEKKSLEDRMKSATPEKKAEILKSMMFSIISKDKIRVEDVAIMQLIRDYANGNVSKEHKNSEYKEIEEKFNKLSNEKVYAEYEA